MDAFIAISTCASLLILLIVTNKLTGLINFRNMSISMLYFCLYFLIYVASIFIFLNSEDIYTKYNYYFMVYSGTIFYIIGLILAKSISKKNKLDFNFSVLSYNTNEQIDVIMDRSFNFLFFISILFIIIYIFEVRDIPAFHLYMGDIDSSSFAEMREESFKLLNSRLIYIYAWNRTVYLPFLAMYSFAKYLITSKRVLLYRFLIVMLVAVINASFSGAEAPIAEIFLQLFLVYYIYKQGKVNITFYLLMICIVFSYSVILPFVIDGGGDVLGQIKYVYMKVLKRFTYDTAERLYHYTLIFDNIGFLQGGSNRITAMLLGQPSVNVPNLVFRILFPQRLASGHANAPAIGYAYSDFGIMGSILFSILIGFIAQIVQIYHANKPRSIYITVSYVFCINAFRKLLSTHITTVLLTHGVLIIIILPYILMAFSKGHKYSRSNSKLGKEEYSV